MNILEAAKLVQGAVVRHGTDGWADTGAGTVVVQSEEWEAAEFIARYAALREDDTPVDAEWLERVGARLATRSGTAWKRWEFQGDRGGVYVTWTGGWSLSGGIYYESTTLLYNPTRGDVRKLCDVLGIELREDV